MYKLNVAATVLAALALSSASAIAEPNSPSKGHTVQEASCVFDHYRPVVASSLMGVQNVGYGNYTFLKGAQVYIRAEPGLTKEWLELAVRKQLKEGKGKLCDSGIKLSQASVESGGDGFWVQLVARRVDDADSLLRWAKRIANAQHALSGAVSRAPTGARSSAARRLLDPAI